VVGDSDPEVLGSGGCGSNGVVANTRDAPFMHVHGTARRRDALRTRRAVPVQGSKSRPGGEPRWRLPGAAGWPGSCGADRRGAPWRRPQRSSRACSDRRRASCDPPLAEHGSGSIPRRRQPDTQGRLSGPRSPCRVRRRRGSSSLRWYTPGSPCRMNPGRESDRSAPERLSRDRVRRTGSRVACFGPRTPKSIDPRLLRSIRPTRAAPSGSASAEPHLTGHATIR
jgi:hypothetical protein